MNSTDLQILVKLKDEASSGFKAMGKNIDTASKDMGHSVGILSTDVSGFAKVLGGVALGAGAALTAFLYSSVKAAGAAEVAMARVTTILGTMGSAAMKNKDAILKAADAAVKLGFDDEDAAESISKLYQRTGDLNKAMSLNKLAMDLARAKHLELAEATTLVGQVLSGNGRLLKQYGIELSDTLTPLEALKQLQGQVAGQADAFSKTFEGQMTVLTLSFNNIKEAIGGALIKSLMPWIEKFTSWLNDPETKKSFDNWTAEFQSWSDVIIPTVIGVFQLWWDIIKGIYDTIMKISASLDDVIKKIGTFIDRGKVAAGSASQTLSNGLVGRIFGLASGGPVSSGSPYIVGEEGPELFVPSSSGSIIPNGRMGGGSVAITVNMNGGLITQDVARQIGDMMITQFRRINKI